jgi:hypothetical protein
MTIEQELTEYLDRQASTVEIHDGLDHIVRGVTSVPFAPAAEPRSWRRPALIAASLAIVAAGGVAVAALPGDHAAAPVQPASADTAPQPAPPTTRAAVSLPGGAVLQGFTPECTTTDDIVFDCTLPSYPTEGQDVTGMVQAIVDETSHVSGGCRSVAADGTRWTCFIGERAVAEQIVDPGFLGDWAARGFAHG